MKCMASLATFRKMQKDRLTIYDVIGQLSGQVIIEQNIKNTDYASLRDLMKREAGIDVPTSMFRPSLKRIDFVDADKSQVSTNEKLTEELRTKTIESLQTSKLRDEAVYDALIGFVEEKQHASLPEKDKEQLKKDFCSYIVKDAYNVKYAEDISNFFLAKQSDRTLMEQIAEIREGLIIFLGLSYNVKDDQIDVLDSPLCLYLDTEILFHMAGYNGELFRCLFDEFYEQVTAINKKANKPLVKLMFFEETNKEIDYYFNKAEDIVKGKDRLDISKTAMRTIVRGCKETYEVVQKKAEFKLLLSEKGIALDTQRNYYDKDNAQFNNVEQQTLTDLTTDEVDEQKVYEKLCMINYIFIKRGYKAHQIFRNVGHILVSGNTLTFEVAKRMDYQPGDVPLVWGMDALINRFWLMLNKGIIPSTQLKSFDVLSKARIVLSSKVNISVERLFKEIECDIESGKIDRKKADIGIAELRKYPVTPDDITAENVDSYTSILNEPSIEQLIAESEARQRKTQELIDKQADMIRERDISIAEIEDQKRLAIKRLTEKANVDIKRDYDAAVKEYESEQYSYVVSELRRYALKQVKIGVIYLGVVVLLYILIYLYGEEKRWYIGFSIGLVVFLAPFIRPLMNHLPIKKAYQFVFCRKERAAVRHRFMKEYENQNRRPVLQRKKESDIYKELRNSQN